MHGRYFKYIFQWQKNIFNSNFPFTRFTEIYTNYSEQKLFLFRLSEHDPEKHLKSN